MQLSFDDPGDTGRASRGLVAQLDGGKVAMGDHLVFDVADHAFITRTSAPPTVHPGLWRQAGLNTRHGLFEVAEGVWQVRGYDLANITLLAGDDGWLVIDPLTNAPAAAASLELANRALGRRPVRAVVYTHSHVYHFGGVLGVTSQEEVDAGDVRIEMNFFFPDRRLLCMAENCTHTLTTSTPSAEHRPATPWPGRSTSTRPCSSGATRPTPSSPATTGPAGATTTCGPSWPCSATSTAGSTTRPCDWPTGPGAHGDR